VGHLRRRAARGGEGAEAYFLDLAEAVPDDLDGGLADDEIVVKAACDALGATRPRLRELIGSAVELPAEHGDRCNGLRLISWDRMTKCPPWGRAFASRMPWINRASSRDRWEALVLIWG